MDKCPICKKGRKANLTLNFKKHVYRCFAIENLLKKLCKNCYNSVIIPLGNSPSENDFKRLYASLNGLLASDEVRQIRKNLNMTQKDAARICGGGVNAFSRYELGKSTPSRGISNLLRLLSRHPEELKYLLEINP
jgi:putative zinc finger/helix-turn-helix YgiT family protein